MQIQAAEHIAKALFLASFEMVPLKDRLRAVLVPSLADHISVAPHQVARVLPTHGGELLYLGAFPGLVLYPRVLLLGLVGRRQGAPLAFGQLGGQAVQFIGPLVVADTPTAKLSQFNAVEELARTRPAVGVKIAGPALPAVLVFVQQHRQVLTHIGGSVQNAVQHPGAKPEGLPAQGPVAIIVDTGALELVAVDFHFGVVEEGFHFASVQPSPRFGLLAGPVHKLGVDAVQRPDAFRGLGAQPLAQGGLVSALLQPQ